MNALTNGPHALKWGAPPGRPQGAGVLDVLVALSVMAVGALGALPATQDWGMQARTDAVSRQWLALLARGRDEARRLGQTALLCAAGLPRQGAEATRAARCDDAAALSGCDLDESSGIDSWRVRHDRNWNCAWLVSASAMASEPVLLHETGFDTRFDNEGDASPLRFVPPLGRIAGHPRHFEIAARHALPGRHGRGLRCVHVASSGRVRDGERPCLTH
jgi:Tfp pilus assembly protein FimT